VIVQPASCLADLYLPQATGVQVLHPGDVALGERDEHLETLLGSCVSIVLTDPRRTLGVMCHIVHSKPPLSATQPSTAYAEVALEQMYAMLRMRGIEPTLCEAYVYGGGNMFPELFSEGHVGDDNARWALAALAHDGVRVLFHDLGGNTYRRLTWTVGPDLPQVVAVPV
jgi:chemotaxis protein CheD